jgi:hypothetical protein
VQQNQDFRPSTVFVQPPQLKTPVPSLPAMRDSTDSIDQTIESTLTDEDFPSKLDDDSGSEEEEENKVSFAFLLPVNVSQTSGSYPQNSIFTSTSAFPFSLSKTAATNLQSSQPSSSSSFGSSTTFSTSTSSTATSSASTQPLSWSAPLPIPQTVSPPPDQFTQKPRKRPVVANPEDFGLNSKYTVVCSSIPPELSKKGEIAAFFKDCSIALGADYSSKVNLMQNGFCSLLIDILLERSRHWELLCSI